MVRAKKKQGNDPSYRTLKADYYPVQRQVNLCSGSQSTLFTLDVGRNLSRVNHRLYRQGKTYQVKIDLDNRVNVDTGPAQIHVYALADTWYVQKAWQLARATYLKATSEEREMMSSQQKARWEDFRVTAGVSGSADVHSYRYSRTDLAGSLDQDGESVTSVIVMADGSTRNFGWNGGTGTYNMLDQYSKSGDTDGSPSTIDSDKPYDGVDDETNETQMDNLADHGNLPPYNATTFTGSPWVKIATLDNSGQTNPGGGSGHARMSTGFFNAPCGLVVLQTNIATTLAGNVSMTAKAGDYKGVAAMNMGA